MSTETSNKPAVIPTDREAYYAEIRRLKEAGWTQRRLMARYGKSRATIRRDIAAAMGTPESDVPHETAERPRKVISLGSFRVVSPGDDRTEPLVIQGGRLTQSGMGKIGVVIPPPGDWRLDEVSPDDLRRMAPAELMGRMVRASPEAGRAYYDALRMMNSGWAVTVINPITKEPDDRGQELTDLTIRRLARRHGSLDVLLNRMNAGVWLRGAVFAEGVFSSDRRTLVDIALPDPYTARFEVAADPEVGDYWQLIQGSGQTRVVLDRETVKYLPLDPLPDTPYGTAPVSPGLFPALFLITMLQDARRVIMQQGWPRLNIMVKLEEILSVMPEEDRGDPEAMRAYVDQAVAEVSQAYGDLPPDMAWVHTSAVEFGEAIGAIGSLDGIGDMVETLERMSVRAFKTMPLLFGMQDGVSEANANRQWEVHVAGIKSMQGLSESALSAILSLELEANGIPAEAVFLFDELRSSEELRDAQTLGQKLTNAQQMELLGYESHEAAGSYAVGHEPPEDVAIGVVGNEDTTPAEEQDEDAIEDDEEITPDDGDSPTGDEGANRLAFIDRAITALAGSSNPHAMALAMGIISGRIAPREVPKMKPPGSPQSTGKERVTVDRSDLRLATADFNGRVDEQYRGLLSATPIPGTDSEDDDDGSRDGDAQASVLMRDNRGMAGHPSGDSGQLPRLRPGHLLAESPGSAGNGHGPPEEVEEIDGGSVPGLVAGSRADRPV